MRDARSRASCATSRRFPSPRRSGCSARRRCSTSTPDEAPATKVTARRRCSTRSGAGASERVLRTRGAPRRAVARSARRAAVPRHLHRRRARAAAREGRAVPVAKSIVGARGHEVTPLQRVVIALQACVLVLNLDLALYDGFENVVVYPDEFVPGWEWEDEAGVVHRNDDAARRRGDGAGGPVVLSWPDVEAATDWDAAGMNLVIHEFAHKLDMRDGDANGCPPLPPEIRRAPGRRRCPRPTTTSPPASTRGEEHGDRPATRPRARASSSPCCRKCSSPSRCCCNAEYPAVYRLFAAFYRQDPGAHGGRAGRAAEATCRRTRALIVVSAAYPHAREAVPAPGERAPIHRGESDEAFAIVTLAAATLFAAGSAFACHCPQDMAKIDAALAKNPKLTDAADGRSQEAARRRRDAAQGRQASGVARRARQGEEDAERAVAQAPRSRRFS